MFENEYLSCKSIDEIRKILSDLMVSRSPLSKNLFVTEKAEDSYIVRSASWSRYTFRPSAVSHTLKLYKAGNVVRIKTKWKPTVRSFSIMFLIILAWLLIICTSGIASTTEINFFEMLTVYGQGLFLAVGLGVLATAVFVFIEKIKLSRFINNHLLKADYNSQQLKTEQNSIEQVDRYLYTLNNESIVAFVKEKVPKEDEALFDSFRIKDYSNDGLRLWHDGITWVADREREIYFTYVSGGSLEVPKQYTLVWKGDKIVVFLESRAVRPDPEKMLEIDLHWNILNIRAPIKLKDKEAEIIDLVKAVSIAGNNERFKLSMPTRVNFVKAVE